MKEIFMGRLRLIDMLHNKKVFSLSVGSKDVSFASINLDLERASSVTLVGDATQMPFKTNAFDEVIFTDVIEHLPESKEITAFKEIHRVLKKGGSLIFSCPNTGLAAFLDPAFWVTRHRHYSQEVIMLYMEKAMFRIKQAYSVGFFWTILCGLWGYLIVYPTRRFVYRRLKYTPLTFPLIFTPSIFKNHMDQEHDFSYGTAGCTIFMVATSI